MAEFYRLRFRNDGKVLYAAHGSQFDGCPMTLWYLVKSPGVARQFKNPAVAHRVLQGVKVFRELLLSGAVWEIVHCSERVVESGTSNIRVLRARDCPSDEVR